MDAFECCSNQVAESSHYLAWIKNTMVLLKLVLQWLFQVQSDLGDNSQTIVSWQLYTNQSRPFIKTWLSSIVSHYELSFVLCYKIMPKSTKTLL